MKKNFLLLFLIPLFSSPLFSQTPTWSAYTTTNTSTQLCNHRVQCINFDADGNKWFGTGGGVSKFTGNSWYNYSVADGLCYFDVNCITCDSEGNTWFGTWGGLSKFDGTNWTTYTGTTTNNQFQGDWVFSIVIDSIGNKWLGTIWGIYKYDGISFTHFEDPFTQSNDWITTMVADSNFNLWCGSSKGEICSFNGENWTVLDTVTGLINNSVESIAIDKKGNKWIGSLGGGLFKFDGNTWTQYTTLNGLANNNVCSIALDSLDNKWIATWGGGVSVFSGTDWTTYNKSNSGLKSDQGLSIAIDKSGNKWYGNNNGVARFDGITWTTFQSNGLGDNVVDDIEIDKEGNKWYATGHGFSKFDGTKWNNYTQDDGLVYNVGYTVAIDSSDNKWFGTYEGVSVFDGNSWINYDTTNNIFNNPVYTIEVDKNNNKWFGTLGGGAKKFDGSVWTTYRKSNSNIKSDSITSILFDSIGNTWFGTYGHGVSKFDGTIWQNYTTLNGLGSNKVLSIAKDKLGNIWFGTEWGVSKFDGTNWTNYDYTNSGLTRGNIYSLAIDEDNNKWIGSWWSGLFDFDDVTWKHYDFDSGNPPLYPSTYNGFFNLTTGFSVISVLTVKIDKDGNKWMGTPWGISKLSITDPVIFTITPQNFDVNKEQGSVSYRITSNVPWADTCDSDWCTIAPLTTGGNGTIMVNYSQNYSDTTRIGSIFINADGLGPQHVTLTQHSDLSIIASVNPINSGTITGMGSYNFGTIVTLTATSKKGYAFVNWTENGIEISKDSSYIFTITEDRIFVANFLHLSGTSDIENALPVCIYPNPAKDIIAVDINKSTSIKVEISIYNISGSLLQKSICVNSLGCELDVSALPAGSYLVQINTGNELVTRKLLIIR